MSEQLEAIRARLKAATPGPWEVLEKYKDWDTDVWWLDDKIRSADGSTAVAYTGDGTAGDAHFIAHAPSDIAVLLALVDAGRAETEDIGRLIRGETNTIATDTLLKATFVELVRRADQNKADLEAAREELAQVWAESHLPIECDSDKLRKALRDVVHGHDYDFHGKNIRHTCESCDRARALLGGE